MHPAYWKDRLQRLQALGCNTVSFYVPWNVHEPKPGVYFWKGFADVEAYLKLIKEMGMNVLLRLGPYICAGKPIHSNSLADLSIPNRFHFQEVWPLAKPSLCTSRMGLWRDALVAGGREHGAATLCIRVKLIGSHSLIAGFPAIWQRQTCPAMQVDGGGQMSLRDNDPGFLQLVDRWFAVMLPRMRPFLIDNGGPVLMVQVRLAAGLRALFSELATGCCKARSSSMMPLQACHIQFFRAKHD